GVRTALGEVRERSAHPGLDERDALPALVVDVDRGVARSGERLARRDEPFEDGRQVEVAPEVHVGLEDADGGVDGHQVLPWRDVPWCGHRTARGPGHRAEPGPPRRTTCRL